MLWGDALSCQVVSVFFGRGGVSFWAEIGEWLFSNVGEISGLALTAAGIVILTVSGTHRWTGLFLLLSMAGTVFSDDGG